MTTLEFKSKISENTQTINVNNGITTFIGGNGSGKSSILEAIFEKYIEDDNFRVICFSSGQNELFTELFNKHKQTNRKYLRERNEPIQSFYFNNEWIKLLIFWSSIFKENGLVRTYLKEKGYIEVDNLGDDISSRLDFRFRVRKNYVLNIRKEIEKEELGNNENDEGYELQENLLRKTEFHETLEKIINVFDIDFDFQNNDNLVKRWLTFDSKKAFEVFTHKNVNKLFSFWALATNGWLSNSELSEFNLRFKNNIQFKHLSDGEYQILSTYAIIDLFDNENTIFLFDEIDSHLYYKNLSKMWGVLNNSQGIIITTTHISESILHNKIENIKVIENGRIEESLTFLELSNRLNNIVGQRNYQFKILSRVQYPVIIDNINDWTIFKKLAIKKMGAEVSIILNKFLPIAKTSSFNNTAEIFGKGKLLFIDEFRKEICGAEILTKEMFLICDKDVLPDNQINQNLTVNIHRDFNDVKSFNNNQTRTHLLSWKRREIENYLLAPSLFEAKNCNDAVNSLYNLPNYDIGNNLDNITDFRNGDFKTVLRPLYNIDGSGFNEEMLEEMISHIQVDEISNDIELVYNYLKDTIA
ncbi:ATP-binding protein [Kaistella daneshvariae]|uniref:ATP-binding protein n=1 Tax=Kaistella daneshvariae TaxID=2487074 RepID=A0ABM7C8Z0_9FLAO|nr:AAA family ATPase [Kaistella daneshvariae]AZI67467.1 ATP-binding protein [Kaistella daneshvariae]